jgi:AcrR family transcriptional regulator
MTRWDPDPAGRLEAAALELFAQQGYAATTVPQITERAGLTKRTFFRHFADKRDVLFLHEREFPDVVARSIQAAPADLPPLDLITQGLTWVLENVFAPVRTDLLARRELIRANPPLHERELLKWATLTSACEVAFRDRDPGMSAETAGVLAHFASMTLQLAVDRWLDDTSGRPAGWAVEETLDVLAGALGAAGR